MESPRYAHRCVKHFVRETVGLRKGAAAICVFCAGSNVTGLLADVPRMTSLVHQYGASTSARFLNESWAGPSSAY